MTWLSSFGLESFMRLQSSEVFVGTEGSIFQVAYLHGWHIGASWWWEASFLFHGCLHRAAWESSWHGSWLSLVWAMEFNPCHIHSTLLVTQTSPDLVWGQELRFIWDHLKGWVPQIWNLFIQQIFIGACYMPGGVPDTEHATRSTSVLVRLTF